MNSESTEGFPEPLFHRGVAPNHLLYSWPIYFFPFCVKIPYHWSPKQVTKPEPAPLTGGESRGPSPGEMFQCLQTHMRAHTLAHTHTHTGVPGLPIISWAPQTFWFLPTVSEWEPLPLVIWKGFSTAKGKELLLFRGAQENLRNLCKKRYTPNQPNPALAAPEASLSAQCPAWNGFLFQGAGNSVIRIADDRQWPWPLSSYQRAGRRSWSQLSPVSVWVWVPDTHGGFNSTVCHGSGD